MQDELLRFSCKDKSLKRFDGFGRSFYICLLCLKDNKKLTKSLKNQCKNNKDYTDELYDIVNFNNL